VRRKTKKNKKTKKIKTKRPTFEWRGCLADLKDKYSSVELQRNIYSL